jgi:hypothetical protein
MSGQTRYRSAIISFNSEWLCVANASERKSGKNIFALFQVVHLKNIFLSPIVKKDQFFKKYQLFMKSLSHFNSKSRRFDSINDLRDFQFSSTLFIKIFFIHQSITPKAISNQ